MTSPRTYLASIKHAASLLWPAHGPCSYLLSVRLTSLALSHSLGYTPILSDTRMTSVRTYLASIKHAASLLWPAHGPCSYLPSVRLTSLVLSHPLLQRLPALLVARTPLLQLTALMLRRHPETGRRHMHSILADSDRDERRSGCLGHSETQYNTTIVHYAVKIHNMIQEGILPLTFISLLI